MNFETSNKEADVTESKTETDSLLAALQYRDKASERIEKRNDELETSPPSQSSSSSSQLAQKLMQGKCGLLPPTESKFKLKLN